MNFLTRLQEDLRARLLTVLPAGVSVLMQRAGALELNLAEALGTLNVRDGRSGAAAVVRMPRLELAQGGSAGSGALGAFASEAWEDRAGPQLLAHLEVELWENRLLNRPASAGGEPPDPPPPEPLPGAEDLALGTLAALHGFRPGGSAGGAWLAARKALEPLESRRSGLAGYLVRLETQLGLEPVPAAARPTGLAEGPPGGPWLLALACATAGADIHYTLDGSYPWPENPAAAAYTEPVTLTAEPGETPPLVRAAAYLPPLAPSDVLELRLA
jgi:hypothetical protein